MNILVLSHEYPPVGGGGANACKYLCREYAKQGHSVTVVTVAFENTPAREKVDGVDVIRLNAKRTKVDTSSFAEMFSFLRLADSYVLELCKQNKYDVCQVFFGIPSGPIALHLKCKYGIPYVVRFGGGDIPGAQKRFKYIYKLLSPFIRLIWKNAKHLVANSEILRNRALEFEDRYRISIIPNGVDSELYCRTNDEIGYSEIRMLFVSRLIEGKGLQYVIPRIEEINQKVGKRVTLTIVGDGPYRQELETLAENRKDLVSFVGRKVGKELLDYYNKANLFILPSLSEGMPNVVLEAMAMKLPIAMTNCGGSKELINGNGFAVGIDEFVDELIKLCKDDEKLKNYGMVSRERTEKLFSWENVAKEYEKLLYE